MKKFALLLMILLIVSPAYAGHTVSTQSFEDHVNEEGAHGGSEESSQTEVGLGLDVLIHEDKYIDVVQENKLKLNGSSQFQTYTVVKTKRSLVDIVKRWTKRGE